MPSRRWLGLAAWLPLLAAPALVQADSPGWGSSRGGPERDGHRPGSAELGNPQVKWRERLGGGLGNMGYWIETGELPQVHVATGGRLRVKLWDDALRWETPLYALDQVVAAVDPDGDGNRDVTVAAAMGPSPVLAAIGRDAAELWISPTDDLAPLAAVRIVDLDGDGVLDVYASFIRASSSGAVAAAWLSPAGGFGSPAPIWTLPATDRDYVAGFQDVVAEIDGTAGLEIVAPGHRRIYVYDAVTGALESTSAELPPIPYGRATLRPADVDGDGDAELLAFSNQAWAAPNNRRYVGLLDWDPTAGAMVFRWARDVADAATDRVAFADESVIDLDGDGALEVVFSIYEEARATWTLEVRDAGTGTLLDALDGSRFSAVAGGVVFTADEDVPLAGYRFTRAAGLSASATGRVREPARCRIQQPPATAPATAPCLVTFSDGAVGLVVVERQQTTGRAVALEVVELDSPSLAVRGRYVPASDLFVSSTATIPGPGTAALAVATTDGRLLALDAELVPVPPDPEIPYSWSGIEFGTAFSGYDLPAFPLAIPAGEAYERVLAVAGGGTNVRALDASDDPSFAGGVDLSWIAVGKSRGIAIESEPPLVVTVDTEDGFEARAADRGDVVWGTGDLFGSDDNIVLHSDPLLVEGAPDRLWFHRRDNNRGAVDLTAIDVTDGAIAFQIPDLDLNNAGWRRLSLGADGQPLSGRLIQVWRYDAADGSVVDQTAAPSGPLAIGLDPAAPTTFLSVGLTSLSLHSAGVATALWNVPHPNAAGSDVRQGGRLDVGPAQRFAVVDAVQPVLRIYALDTGAELAQVRLVGGSIAPANATPPVPLPSLGNVTSIDDLTGAGDPAFLVGSSDGFLYAVSPDGAALLWSVDLGAPIGEVVPIDWDGDDLLELVVSTGHGTVIGLDAHTGEPPMSVIDTDPPSAIYDRDVESIRTLDSLHAAWDAVPGATSYQVGVFTAFGDEISDGFVDVGGTTSATLTGLALVDGDRYVLAVRAVSDLGVSPDAVSNGVTAHLPDDDGGTPVGCGCQSGRPVVEGSALLVLVFAAIWFVPALVGGSPRRRQRTVSGLRPA